VSTLPAALLLSLSLAGCAVATETPRYQVVERGPALEVREYQGSLVAETVVEGTREEAGNEGFRRLAGYIFGKNRGERKIAMTAPVGQTEAPAGAKIAMTAPVSQTAAGERWVIAFTMPAAWRLETLPEPLDDRIRFREVPPRRVAAIRYSGTWSGQRYEEHLARLRAAMAGAGLREGGPPEWARYDPPFKPWFLRRNEILIPLASTGPT
jgi:hypothetical protein